ncbi:MAG: hypothetical protein IJK27_02320 [Bacilli bacterium]|nr:hypothetical protein [Bacilli bacterium]
MIENEQKMKEILQVLNDEGILSNVIIIGSWSLFFYKEIFENFSPMVRTRDIDFYVPSPKQIKERDNVIASLKSLNYDFIRDTLTHKSTFISPDDFELEFLTKLNKDNLACVKLGNTNIYAESISYVEIFSNNYVEILYQGIKVKVASPASYVLQKLLINNKRKDKKEKDIESVRHVLNYINGSRKYSEELKTLFESLPKTWKKKIKSIVEANDLNLDFK